jgi:uncharacterized protein (DUF736 family)
MIIGHSTYSKAQDRYTGELATLTAEPRRLVFQPSEATAEKAPNYRVVGQSNPGDIEFGAAWKSRSKEGWITSRSSSTIRLWRGRSTAP